MVSEGGRAVKDQEEMIDDIRLQLAIYQRRAKHAHRQYLATTKQAKTLENMTRLFDRECAFYAERGEMLAVCRVLKNLLTDAKRQKLDSNLYKSRDRRWRCEKHRRLSV